MNTQQTNINYLPLGDSYTIGEGAKPEEAWPEVLTAQLNSAGIPIKLLCNPAVTGWTTKDLIEKELPVFDDHEVDFTTILIGVNDWVQGVTKEDFHKNLVFIINHVQNQLTHPENLLLINIPDFGVAPNGQQYSKGRDISKGLQEFNSIIASEAEKRNLRLVDIYPSSLRMASESDLVAEDGIHGSGKMYAIWEQLIYPEAYKLLS